MLRDLAVMVGRAGGHDTASEPPAVSAFDLSCEAVVGGETVIGSSGLSRLVSSVAGTR